MLEPIPVWRESRLWALSIAETLVWASLFYIFPASLLRWNTHFGWSVADLSLGFTYALIASAISSIIAGHLIDRGKSRSLMTVCTLVGACLISLIPSLTNLWQFYTVWILIGIALSGCLYESCFSYLTRTFQEGAKRPIIMVTIFAGFASTVSYPTSAYLSRVFSWEVGIYIFALVTFLITAPLFWYGTSMKTVATVKEDPSKHSHGSQNQDKLSITLRAVIQNPIFWGLLITFTTLALNQGMVISQIFPLLESRQISTGLAIFLASCIGPMQVIARLLFFCVESLSRKNIPIVRVALFCQICLAVSSISLVFGGISTSVIVSFVLLQGGPYGLVSIIRPLITAELLGRTNFGVISSIVGIGFVWGFAIAPGIAGKVAERWSYDEVLLTTFSASVVGIISLLLTLQLKRISIQS